MTLETAWRGTDSLQSAISREQRRDLNPANPTGLLYISRPIRTYPPLPRAQHRARCYAGRCNADSPRLDTHISDTSRRSPSWLYCEPRGVAAICRSAYGRAFFARRRGAQLSGRKGVRWPAGTVGKRCLALSRCTGARLMVLNDAGTARGGGIRSGSVDAECTFRRIKGVHMRSCEPDEEVLATSY
jgi:hypothetical protein